MRFLTAVLVWLSSHVAAQTAPKPGFISPKWQDTTSTAPFAANSRWPLGSSQIIAFSSPWESYRIEFWQGILSGGARKSEQLVYNQSAGDTLPQSFYWTVQTYDLELSQSPVFFFWLRDNNDPDNHQQSSANFNITLDTESTSSASSSGVSTSSSGARGTSSGTTAAATTTAPSTLSSTSGPSVTAAPAGLSRGAAAGIGVGAALGAVLIVVPVVFFFMKRRQQRLAELPGPEPAEFPADTSKTLVPPVEYYSKPVEAHGYQRPVELGT